MTTAPTEATPTTCPGCARGLDRRSFLSAATLAAVAVALDACSALTGPGGGWNGSYGGPFTVTLANFSALGTVGGVARVDSGSGAPTALYRSSSTNFVAVALVCPHAGYYPVEVISTGFYCPAHGSWFSKTGGVQSGPAPSGLTTFPATYDATTGTVLVNRPT